MEKKSKIKAIRSQDTIVLHYEGKVLNISKKEKPNDFIRIEQLMIVGDEALLKKAFEGLYKQINDYTNGYFIYENGEMYLKGDKEKELLPTLLKDKIVSFFKSKVNYIPLINFWKKLKKNPSEDSKKDLYDFMTRNNIPITEEGDIIVEKGVREIDGKLFDDYTGKIDNSIGKVVILPRDKVNADRNITCSYGLHVGAPDYVRNIYSNKTIIVCTVNPEHVVSVPTDYNATKMRVCQYRVMSYSSKSSIDFNKLVINKDEILDKETIVKERVSNKKAKKEVKRLKVNKRVNKVSSVAYSVKVLNTLKAREIIAKVFNDYDVKIDIDLKNKKSIIKKAIDIHSLNS